MRYYNWVIRYYHLEPDFELLAVDLGNKLSGSQVMPQDVKHWLSEHPDWSIEIIESLSERSVGHWPGVTRVPAVRPPLLELLTLMQLWYSSGFTMYHNQFYSNQGICYNVGPENSLRLGDIFQDLGRSPTWPIGWFTPNPALWADPRRPELLNNVVQYLKSDEGKQYAS